MEEALALGDVDRRPWPRSWPATSSMLYLGRGVHYPVALEGALKLKEISYIHAEGYAAGEMKHGPIALIDDRMPVVALAPARSVLRPDARQHRGGARPRRPRHRGVPRRTIRRSPDAPTTCCRCRPRRICSRRWSRVIPLQLLAYHIAVLRGLDVDQPRNLAKSVTVE